VATVLLVIDVQRALVDALNPRRQTEFLDVLRGLLDRARAGGTPVVYVRHDGAPDELVAGTAEWEIAHEIAPKPGEPIVDKRFRDAFRETNLADVLAKLEADHIIACGMQSEFCVDATVREAERRGYRVTFVEDGHATFDAEDATEQQIRSQVNRVASGIARLMPAARVFASETSGVR